MLNSEPCSPLANCHQNTSVGPAQGFCLVKGNFCLPGVACSGGKFLVFVKHRKPLRCIFLICCKFPPRLWSSLLPVPLCFFKSAHLRTPLPLWNCCLLCQCCKSTPSLAAMLCLSTAFELWDKTSTTSLRQQSSVVPSYCFSSHLEWSSLFLSISCSSLCKLVTINSH